MTETEWLMATHPPPMLEFLRGKSSARKLRLGAIACCLRFSQLLADHRTRIGLLAADDFCEGRISDKQRAAAEQAVLAVITADLGDVVKTASPIHYIALAVRQAARRNRDMWFAAFQTMAFTESAAENRLDERFAHVRVLRDIFGNPFLPIDPNPSWLTSDVLALARGIYAEKAFDRMPILADALQDAGCENADVLDHCRGPGPHVRGCWLVDLLLGKG